MNEPASLLFRLCSIDPVKKLCTGKRRAVGNHRAFCQSASDAADHLRDLVGKTVLCLFIPEMFQKFSFFPIEKSLRCIMGIGKLDVRPLFHR